MSLDTEHDAPEQKCPFARLSAVAKTRDARPARRSSSRLPGPRKLPLLGNILQCKDRTKFHLILEQWADQFGPVYEFRIGWKPIVVLAQTEAISQLLRDRPDVNSRGSFDRLLAEIGFAGVATASGESWKKQRRLVTQSMNTKQLRAFFPAFAKITRRLQKRLGTKAHGQAVGVVKEMSLYTIDVISNLGFGHDLNIIENETSVVPEHLGKVLPFVARRLQMPFPYWRYFKLPIDRKFDESLQAVREVVTECIALGRKRLAENPDLAANPTNLMDVLLSADDGSEARIDDDEIFANLMSLLLGGSDTTANNISWILYFLCKHPEAQRRVQDEVRSVLGPADMPRNLEEVEKLEYLTAVVHESMRLKTPGPTLFRQCREDLDIDGFHIPKETLIILLPRHAGLQESNFAAAKEFRPERWLSGNPSGVHKRSAFFPFGTGLRICPGRSLALVESKMAIAMICQNFHVSPATPIDEVEEHYEATMEPRNLAVYFDVREKGKGAAAN